ncbi:MAG: hypothetical protein ACLU3I_03865 [Acutalibacteraceae bacterium]
MNVSFSTRGWQQIPWEQQVQMAETMRFGGVELYNVHKTPELTGRGGPLHRYTAAATRGSSGRRACASRVSIPPATSRARTAPRL